MATIYEPITGKSKVIVSGTNWILRHKQEIDGFIVEPASNEIEAILKACLKDGRVLQVLFADSQVLYKWLHRPKLRGLKVHWKFGDKERWNWETLS